MLLRLGTVTASKAVIVDANKDITGFRNVNAASYSIGGTAITSTADELNLLDGVSGLVQSDFTKLAAVDFNRCRTQSIRWCFWISSI